MSSEHEVSVVCLDMRPYSEIISLVYLFINVEVKERREYKPFKVTLN